MFVEDGLCEHVRHKEARLSLSSLERQQVAGAASIPRRTHLTRLLVTANGNRIVTRESQFPCPFTDAIEEDTLGSKAGAKTYKIRRPEGKGFDGEARIVVMGDLFEKSRANQAFRNTLGGDLTLLCNRRTANNREIFGANDSTMSYGASSATPNTEPVPRRSR